ncbi:core trichothecene cluster (CTC) protein 14 [Colletotrichum spaethianum]|uniref:Core trichothecene cluster (CTC) protein 14 n=1 Tax=Colletotrichum spaethianum TaxID=700344 RepID=A0AA37PD76_9PEZI|nr:core trichothecene cluster (CTC) protein 14 [Colletotrichum spaethianum]GKT50062.1 core trichothecene cluster (CTC) protein 14 [Colletotrichum spaethianum]
MLHLTLSSISLLSLLVTKALGACPPFNSTFFIDNSKLYPENLDFDTQHCKLYVGSNFNATVLVYDPYKNTQEILTFDGISHTDPFHISGIDFDEKTGSIFISANSGTPFVTFGQNLTGPNYLIRYDTKTKRVVYKADLAGFLTDIKDTLNLTVNGFQDMAEDHLGNSFVPVDFGVRAIAKVSPSGDVTPWYVSNDTASANSYYPALYEGLVFHPTGKLIVTDAGAGTFVTFDTNAAPPKPRTVKISGFTSDYKGVSCDGLLNPARYPGRDVLLCSEDGINAITVFTTKDSWKTAKYVGQVANNNTLAAGSIPAATVQISNSLYISPFFSNDTGIADTVGNRSNFPFIDITSSVDALVSVDNIKIADC